MQCIAKLHFHVSGLRLYPCCRGSIGILNSKPAVMNSRGVHTHDGIQSLSETETSSRFQQPGVVVSLAYISPRG